MAERTLRNCRVLVVEDDYMLADELQSELADAKAIVLGPVGTVEDALNMVRSESMDGAVLDLNLHGKMAFPVAELLSERRVPFMFVTGYDNAAIPDRFAGVARCQKPVNIAKIAMSIGRVIAE
jgi:DNA-binding response OmpR family regulator